MAADFFDLLISRYSFLNSREKCLLKKASGDADTLMTLGLHDIGVIIGRKTHQRTWKKEKAVAEAEKCENMLASGAIKCLFFQQQDYPDGLSEIYDPPYVLFYRGERPRKLDLSVGVVGTRIPSGAGLDAAFELGFEFGLYGLSVVSGLALGIDSAAHSGNAAAGAPSVAVLGCGPDRIYPSSNRKTAESLLAAGGTLLSEYPPGTEPLLFHFPERNRIISGLSKAVVVVEAPGKSGALITADFAVEQNRDLYFHISALLSAGRNSRVRGFIFDGAPVCSKADDVIFMSEYSICRNGPAPDKKEVSVTSLTAGKELADSLKNELYGSYVKFNGKYFRRACNESPYSTYS